MAVKKKAGKIYSYMLRYDCGFAPNPFGGICTLAVCKPVIRRAASVGDWVVGTGPKSAELKDRRRNFSGRVVYAMKITDKKTLEEYDEFCRKDLEEKIPNWRSKDLKKKTGDCIYDFSEGGESPAQRKGLHNESNMKTDLSGENVLLSNEFYYFGENPKIMPHYLRTIVPGNRGFKICKAATLIRNFEKWLDDKFELNKINEEPQVQYKISEEKFRERFSERHRREDEEDEEGGGE